MRILGFLLWLLAAHAWASGAPPAVLRDLAVLEDPSGSATVASVAATFAAQPQRFRPLSSQTYSAGYSRSAHWLRFALDAPAGEWWLEILPPYLDDLRLYAPDPAHPGRYLERRAGDRLPFEAREVPYRGFVFKLYHAGGAPNVYYLRLQTTSTSILQPRVWAPERFHSAVLMEYGLLVANIAALIMVLAINVIAWFWLRDPLTPWFAAYVGVLAMGLFAVGGFASQYVFPSEPGAADITVGLSSLLNVAFGSAFYRRLFLVDGRQTTLYWIYQAAFFLPLLAITSLFVDRFVEVMPWIFRMVLVMNLIGLWLSFRLWWEKAAGGGLFFLANLISMIGIFFLTVTLLGLIASDFVARYGLQISSIGSVLALHMALGARHRAAREQGRWALEEVERQKRLRDQQSRFFAMMSHELKTPLAVIDGAAQSLQALAPAEPEIELRHVRIRRAVGRITELVDRVLFYDKFESEHAQLRREPVQLAALLDDAVGALALPPARLVCLTSPCRAVLADRPSLKIMIANLIDNALKYSPSDTCVEVSLREAHGAALIEVRDHGPGVVPALRARIFERYFRGDGIGDIPGAGLGLYLVSRIVAQHGGMAECTAPPDGGGALFRVGLPFAEGAA